MKVDYKDNSEQVLSAMEKGIKNGLEAIGLTAETYAKKATPVDTGRLRNSISHTVDGEAVYIGSNVEYAPYVELGTSRAKAHHMLQKAATEHSAEYKRLAEDAVYSAINNSQ